MQWLLRLKCVKNGFREARERLRILSEDENNKQYPELCFDLTIRPDIMPCIP
jgi:hypothetical protein